MSKSTTLGVDGVGEEVGVGGESFERAILLLKACKVIHTKTQSIEGSVAAALRKDRGDQGGSRW